MTVKVMMDEDIIADDTLTVESDLVIEALELGQHQNGTEALRVALESYIQWQRQLQIFNLFGTIDYDSDYKAERKIS